MAFNVGSGSEAQRPLATVVIGGHHLLDLSDPLHPSRHPLRREEGGGKGADRRIAKGLAT